MKLPGAVLLALLACCGAARPLLGPSGIGEETTTHTVAWSPDNAPYPRIEARCGDLLTFKWERVAGREPQEQTVALVRAKAKGGAVALAKCSKAKPLTEPASEGEWTEELLQPGTYYFVEPTHCVDGQILVVKVDCAPDAKEEEEGAKPAATGKPGRSEGRQEREKPVAAASLDAAPAPAGAAGVAAASLETAAAPSPAPAADFAVTETAAAGAPAPEAAAAAPGPLPAGAAEEEPALAEAAAFDPFFEPEPEGEVENPFALPDSL